MVGDALKLSIQTFKVFKYCKNCSIIKFIICSKKLLFPSKPIFLLNKCSSRGIKNKIVTCDVIGVQSGSETCQEPVIQSLLGHLDTSHCGFKSLPSIGSYDLDVNKAFQFFSYVKKELNPVNVSQSLRLICPLWCKLHFQDNGTTQPSEWG